MTHSRDELEKKLYKELVVIAKSLDLKANGKKDEIIDRILESQGGGTSTTTTTTTPTPSKGKKPATKRKLEAKNESESEGEETASEEEIEKPKKTSAKPKPSASKKTAAKKAPSRSTKKLKPDVEEEEEDMEEEEEEEEESSDMKVDPNNNNVKKTTTTTTKSSGGITFKKGPKSTVELKKWHTDGTITYFLEEIINKPKIAGFDMDYTIIKTKSGNVHPVNANDWLYWNIEVPDKLKQLHKDGYHVVIFSNQGGMKSGDVAKYNAITKKIRQIALDLEIPLSAFVATADDDNKKPNRAMWDFMLKHCTDGSDVSIQSSDCFYVGDAAGRPEGWKAGVKADFSSSDMAFAQTVGIDFKTPEQYFLDEPPFEVNLNTLIPTAPTVGEVLEGGGSIISKEFEMVLFVGFPASGKSTFAAKHFAPAGYTIVNGDTLKTKPKQQSHAKLALEVKKSVVIDNTNGPSSTRAEWIELAKKYGASVRCFIFKTPRDLAQHLNYFRERTKQIKHVPEMVYNIYNKYLVEPSKSEGFTEIKHVNFILDLADDMKSQYNIPNPKAKAKKK